MHGLRSGDAGRLNDAGGRDGPNAFLGNSEGILQTDGSIAYEKSGSPKMVHAACWAHARRAFVDALKLNPRDAMVKGLVDLIDELFAVDAEARQFGLDAAGRDVLRQQRSQPLLDQIKAVIEAAAIGTLPASKERKRIGSTWAVHGLDPRSLRFCRSWKRASGWRFPCVSTWRQCCPDWPTSTFKRSRNSPRRRGLPAEGKPGAQATSRRSWSDAYNARHMSPF